MHWNRTLQLVDVHCGGKIGRIVTAGVLDVPGDTMAAKLAHINEVDDSLRRMLTLEPRGGPAGAVVLLVPPTRPEADVGFILLLAERANAMSGSNVMCATTALLETGTVAMREPETRVIFDTAAGLVIAVATCRAGRVEGVRVAMPLSFVCGAGLSLPTAQWGEVAFDLCFGGVFVAIVDAAAVGLDIVPENARALATAGTGLRDQIAARFSVHHPEEPGIDNLAFVMFTSEASDGAVVTCTTLKPGRTDRSACGTGSAALAALRAARGQLGAGEAMITRSIIDSEFETRITGSGRVGDFDAIEPTLRGRCWIYGISQVGLDPTDPFPQGFTLSDTWGP